MIILTAVLALVAVCTAAGLAEVPGADLVCQRCGAIMPGAGHTCSGGEVKAMTNQGQVT